jgi:hypothetical protein
MNNKKEGKKLISQHENEMFNNRIEEKYNRAGNMIGKGATSFFCIIFICRSLGV